MENVGESNYVQPLWPWWRLTLLALNMIALVLSTILSWHYINGASMPGCGVGGSCEQVLNSRWSIIGRVLPVSSLAVGVYLGLLVTSLFIGSSTEASVRQLAWKVLLILVGCIGGSATWFIIIQKLFIGEFCIYCMATHITGLLITGLVSWRATITNIPNDYYDNSKARRQVYFQPLRMVFIGLLVSGLLAVSQTAITPKAIYYNGNSPGNLPVIDYNHAPLMGSPDAPYVIKLLFDYQCPHCQKIHFMLSDAIRGYGGKLAVVLCPSPLNTECNPYVPRDVAAFKNSCELARIGLAVWLAKREAYPAFDNWMFTFESGDRWHPKSLEETRVKAIELVGQDQLDAALSDEWIGEYLQTCTHIFGRTMENGKGGIPKIVYDSHWVIPEPNSTDELIRILQQSLGVPEP